MRRRPRLRAPLWWVADAAAFPELAQGAAGGRHALRRRPTRPRLGVAAWPPQDPPRAHDVRNLARLHCGHRPYTAPPQGAAPSMRARRRLRRSGALRDALMLALLALFALERILTHARRR
jgi:hypothetical protein